MKLKEKLAREYSFDYHMGDSAAKIRDAYLAGFDEAIAMTDGDKLKMTNEEVKKQIVLEMDKMGWADPKDINYIALRTIVELLGEIVRRLPEKDV